MRASLTSSDVAASRLIWPCYTMFYVANVIDLWEERDGKRMGLSLVWFDFVASLRYNDICT